MYLEIHSRFLPNNFFTYYNDLTVHLRRSEALLIFGKLFHPMLYKDSVEHGLMQNEGHLFIIVKVSAEYYKILVLIKTAEREGLYITKQISDFFYLKKCKLIN